MSYKLASTGCGGIGWFVQGYRKGNCWYKGFMETAWLVQDTEKQVGQIKIRRKKVDWSVMGTEEYCIGWLV